MPECLARRLRWARAAARPNCGRAAARRAEGPVPGPKAAKGVPNGSETGEDVIPRRPLGKTGVQVLALGLAGTSWAMPTRSTRP